MPILIQSESAASFKKVVSDFAGKTVGIGKATLTWEDYSSSTKGLGRLAAKLPVEAPPETVAEAMRELIFLTRPIVDAALKQLAA